ncbi:MAG: hypothetical protein WEG40_12755 [Candidatus Rokuibacteriota bacterium]
MDTASRRLVPIFNYDLQVWIVDGMVKPCKHPPIMRAKRTDGIARPCCNADKWRGLTEDEAIAEYEARA